ncbi:MAG: nagJ [bacterium]|nr:nagJ [bacterium]
MHRLITMAALVSLTACTGEGRPVSAALTRPKFLELQPGATWTSTSCVDTSLLAAHDELDAAVDDLFAQAGLRGPLHTTGNAGCQWMVRVRDEAPLMPGSAQLVWDAGSGEPDRFATISAPSRTGGALTTIFATTERGAAFGVRSTLQFLVDRTTDDSQRVLQGTLVDYAGFSRRGIIEGFYGPTFSVDERTKLIDLAGYLRQNTYVYALKDADPFTHAQWRDPYDTTWAPIIASAVSAAKRNFIDFVWAASPGYYGGPNFLSHSIHYGGDADFALLVAKTENLRSLGVQRFALFVDDVAPELVWPDDMARFPSLVAAHAYLMNRWDDYLMATGAPEHLWVVGTKYTSDSTNSLSGEGWQDYNRTLATALHPGIQMFWTGPQVYSERIGTDDLVPITDIVQRPLLIWDNWPKSPEALTGRAPNLDRRAAGLLSNFVMDNDTLAPSAALHDFEQALGTIADYGWQPDTYDPAWSLQRWTPLLDPLLQRMPKQ